MSKEEENPQNVIELSSGVKLLVKAMPPGVFIKLAVTNPPPLPPTYKAGSGEKATFYTNPDDPGYIEARKYWDDDQSRRMLNGMVILGTEIHSIPKGFSKPEDQDWVSDIEVMGIEVEPDNPSWRRLWWTLMKAAPLAEDWTQITNVVGRLSGVPEKDVEAAATFPGS